MKFKVFLAWSLAPLVAMWLISFAFVGQVTTAQTRSLTIVALGDSLVAGYGLAPGEDFPARLQAALRGKGRDVTVINAGVSGDTSAGGLERLDWSVPPEADGVIVELGANDALRGLDPQATRQNIDAIVSRLKQGGKGVLIAGMLAPPNMGHAFGEAFGTIFPEMAEKHGVALYPFFLDGVAGNAELNQSDAMHPTARGIEIMVERMLPTVESWLDTLAK